MSDPLSDEKMAAAREWAKHAEKFLAWEFYGAVVNVPDLVAEIDRLRAESMGLAAANVELKVALQNAIEGMEDMITYVPAYFREKWGHDEYMARAKAALGAIFGETRDDGGRGA